MASIISAGTTSNTALNLSGDTSGVLQLATNGSTTAMTITTGQLVGIGTASPTHRLQVEGNSGAEVKVTRGTNSFVISLSNNIGGDVYVGTSVASALLLQTNNTERMRIDTSGNVGIGTSSPSVILDVRAPQGIISNFSTTGTNPVDFRLTNTGGTTYFGRENSAGNAFGTTAYSTVIWSEGAYPMVFATNGTQRMRIDSSGRVGIGETNLSNTLTVSASQATARFNSTSSSQSVYQQFVTNGISLYLGRDNSAGTDFGTAYATYLYSEGAYPVITWINGSERMRISSSGNVGIGTTNPTFKLQINVAAGADALNITDALTSDFQVKPGVSTGVCRVGPSAGAIAFQTDGSERMRITSDGKVLIGTTTENLGGRLFNVKGTQVLGSFYRETTNTGDECLEVRSNVTSTNALKFRVIASGSVENSTGSYGTISDAKLKENIVDATPKLDKVNQLKVRNYNLIGDDLKQIGFVAQEIEQVFPSIVEEYVDRDEVGNDLGTTTKTVKTTVLIPILVKAIQELKAELDATKAEVAALKGVN